MKKVVFEKITNNKGGPFINPRWGLITLVIIIIIVILLLLLLLLVIIILLVIIVIITKRPPRRPACPCRTRSTRTCAY